MSSVYRKQKITFKFIHISKTQTTFMLLRRNILEKIYCFKLYNRNLFINIENK